jgi:hypothetical protein
MNTKPSYLQRRIRPEYRLHSLLQHELLRQIDEVAMLVCLNNLL